MKCAVWILWGMIGTHRIIVIRMHFFDNDKHVNVHVALESRTAPEPPGLELRPILDAIRIYSMRCHAKWAYVQLNSDWHPDGEGLWVRKLQGAAKDVADEWKGMLAL